MTFFRESARALSHADVASTKVNLKDEKTHTVSTLFPPQVPVPVSYLPGLYLHRCGWRSVLYVDGAGTGSDELWTSECRTNKNGDLTHNGQRNTASRLEALSRWGNTEMAQMFVSRRYQGRIRLRSTVHDPARFEVPTRNLGIRP